MSRDPSLYLEEQCPRCANQDGRGKIRATPGSGQPLVVMRMAVRVVERMAVRMAVGAVPARVGPRMGERARHRHRLG